MFQNIVTNFRRKFVKSTENIIETKPTEKSKIKYSVELLKSKFLKFDVLEKDASYIGESTLSPRAAGDADCATTDIGWPLLPEKNPNILDKFTSIVTIVDDFPNRVRITFLNVIPTYCIF